VLIGCFGIAGRTMSDTASPDTKPPGSPELVIEGTI
jgi:hypothetical protein